MSTSTDAAAENALNYNHERQQFELWIEFTLARDERESARDLRLRHSALSVGTVEHTLRRSGEPEQRPDPCNHPESSPMM